MVVFLLLSCHWGSSHCVEMGSREMWVLRSLGLVISLLCSSSLESTGDATYPGRVFPPQLTHSGNVLTGMLRGMLPRQF